MRNHRQLPLITKVKKSWPASSYFIELHIVHIDTYDFGLSSHNLGEVSKAGSKWDAMVRLDFGDRGSVRIPLRGFHSMRTALQVFRETVERVCDEFAAHAIQEAILTAKVEAEQDVQRQLALHDGDQPLAYEFELSTQRIVGTNEALAEQLSAIREYMGQGKGSIREMRVNSYMARMIEHELVRRANLDEANTSEEL